MTAESKGRGQTFPYIESKLLIFFLMFFFASRSISDVEDGSIKWSDFSFQMSLSQILKMMRILAIFRVDRGGAVEPAVSSLFGRPLMVEVSASEKFAMTYESLCEAIWTKKSD